MPRSPSIAPLLLALTLCATQAQAQEPRRLSDELDLDLRDATLAEAVAEVTRRTGRRIVVASGGEARLSLRLRRVSWRDAVELIAERTGCEVAEARGALVLSRPPRVSLACQGADVRAVILMLARYADADIVIAPQVQGRVSLELRDVPWRRALRAVVSLAGHELLEQDDLVSVGGGLPPDEVARADPEGEARVLEGRLEELTEDALRLRGEDEQVVVLRLGADPAQRRVLSGLARGAALLVACREGPDGAPRVVGVVAFRR